MSAKGSPPTLIETKSMGGIFAQQGFDYQLWDGLARLPAWAANPAFEQVIFEGFEDLEARFFAPHAPHFHLLERYQAKSGDLSPSEVSDVFKSFWRFESHYPQTTRVHTLVTPRLPQTLRGLARDMSRVRRARPFYAPFAGVAAASDASLKADLIDKYGEPLGPFVADAVEVNERSLPDHGSGLHAFGSALARSFPELDVGPRRIDQAFERLSGIVRSSIGVPLSRALIIQAIQEGLGERLPLPVAFPLHIRSDRSETDETALEIDASDFSGGTAYFPHPDHWTESLLAPLDRAARWLRRHGVSRIALGGSYRLSTGMSLGWSLRSAIGFELEIPTRTGPWGTDNLASRDEPAPEWRVSEPAELNGDQLLVSVGVLRDPSVDLSATAGVSSGSVLALHLAEAIRSAAAAQATASVVKRSVDAAVARLQPAGIKLFMAGPAAFAVALGHRWNAMPPTQLHEFRTAERQYVPTARL